MEPNRSEVALNPAFVALLLTFIISSIPLKFYLYLFTYICIYVLLVLKPTEINLLISKMESKAFELVAVLKNVNLSVDAKVAHLSGIKSDIKQKNVPEGAVGPIFESLRLSIASQHSAILAAGFSTLGHFLKRLFIQDQHNFITLQGRILYPLLLERLGDHKERVRAQAAQAFTDMWPVASADVEHYVLEVALVGKNARAKEMSMIWLSSMTKTHGLLFRTYVPSLVACLEEADPTVRDTAKMTVVELFQNAPGRAKSDLKKQMAVHDVRKSTVNAILTSIGLSSEQEHAASISRPPSRGEALHQRPISVMSSRSHNHNEVPKEDPEPVKRRPVSSKSNAPPSEELVEVAVPQNSPPVEDIEPLIVASARELDDMVRSMLPCYDGRESEENWVAREKNVCTLRRVTRGNAPHAFPSQYYSGMKTLLDGIFKVVNSLRTTLCTNGCLLIQDMAIVCGPKIDFMVEIIMQNLVKLCAGMKKISAQNGNTTVDVVIAHVTFTLRILQHTTSASHDKNVQLRLSAAAWVKTILKKQGHHKSSIEHGGGLDLVEKSIKKGLGDANPGVREAMRSTFWVFYGIWTDRANDIMSNLDAKSRSLLEKDPANPNADPSSKDSASRKGASSSNAIAGRSALKEAISARKKAQFKPANSIPTRPESAQSTFADVKTADHPLKSSTVRTVPTGAPISSLSSAPMRPGMKPRRPEVARPATADPFARRPAAPDSHNRAPSRLDSSPRAPKSKSSTPSSTRPRQKTDPMQVSTTKSKPKKLDISRARSQEPQLASRSRSNSNESVVQQHFERARTPATPHRFDALDSPAAIQLESPPRPGMKQPAPAVEPPSFGGEVMEPSHDLNVASEEQSLPEPLHDLPSEMDDHIHHPSVPSNSTRQPEPVVIYEDPVPASAEPEPEHHVDVDAAVPNEDAPVTQPAEHDEPMPEETSAPLDESTLAPQTSDQPSLDHVVDADSTNVETQHELPAPEEPQAPASSSSLIHTPVTHDDSTGPQENSTKEPSDNVASDNENNTPYKLASISSANRSVSRNNALEELPTDEPARRDNKQHCQAEAKKASIPSVASDDRRGRRTSPVEMRRSLSPRSQDPVKAREMVEKGAQRIRAKSMDIHGYRKLQKLIEYHDGLFTDQVKYDELLNALLDELASTPAEKRQPFGRLSDTKTQILLAVRLMFSHHKSFFVAYCPKAMIALVSARKHYQSNAHIVTVIDETAEEIVAICEASDAIDAVLDLIEREEKNEQGYRAITMGVSVLSKTLRRLNGNHMRLSERIVDRLGKFASQNLTDRQPDVRRQVTDLCVQMHAQIASEERFWKVLGSPKENSRNLLTYYIAKAT